jgi:hypothetical protein
VGFSAVRTCPSAMRDSNARAAGPQVSAAGDVAKRGSRTIANRHKAPDYWNGVGTAHGSAVPLGTVPSWLSVSEGTPSRASQRSATRCSTAAIRNLAVTSETSA